MLNATTVWDMLRFRNRFFFGMKRSSIMLSLLIVAVISALPNNAEAFYVYRPAASSRGSWLVGEE
jgi:hypothetical protein